MRQLPLGFQEEMNHYEWTVPCYALPNSQPASKEGDRGNLETLETLRAHHLC